MRGELVQQVRDLTEKVAEQDGVAPEQVRVYLTSSGAPPEDQGPEGRGYVPFAASEAGWGENNLREARQVLLDRLRKQPWDDDEVFDVPDVRMRLGDGG